MNKLIHFLKGPKILIVTTSILIVGSIVLFGFNDDPTSAFQTVPVKIGTVSQEITVTGKIKSAESESKKPIQIFASRYSPALDKKTIRNDLYFEKTEVFENTKTYLAIKQAYAAKYGVPDYAKLPSVEIISPKIKSKLTTAQFATAVNGKYQKCLKKYELSGA